MIPGSLEILMDSWSPKKGVLRWRNRNGFAVIRIHYSADPAKNDAWAEQAAVKFPGGREGADWRAEMEIEFGARGGERVYPGFSMATHVVPSFDIPEEWSKFRGVDPGYNNPTAVLWIAVDGDGCFWVYDEWYRPGLTIPEHAEAIKGKTGRHEVQYTVIDPSAMQKTQMGGGKSIADQYAERGVFVVAGDNRVDAGIQSVANLLKLGNNGEPRLKVLAHCEKTIWEFQNYKYEELTELQKQRRDGRELPRKKDDHAMDALRYVVMQVSPSFMKRHGMRDPHQIPDAATTVRKQFEGMVKKERYGNYMQDLFEEYD